MLRNLPRSKGFWALVLPVVLSSFAFAGGPDCHGKDQAKAGAHCKLMKNVTKTATMTDNGAIVVIEGKNAEAIGHIKSHLGSHVDHADCPDCPFSMEGVTVGVKLLEKGGEVTLTGANADAIKAVQEWASNPAAGCCSKHGTV